MPIRSGDRIIIDENLNKHEVECHISRYRFTLNYVKGKIILDAGCGTGYGCQIMKDGGADLVIGIDCSEGSIDYAKKKFGSKGVEFYCGDLCDSATYENLRIDQFDIIVCCEVIEHVWYPIALLKCLYRHTALKGILILSTPNKLIEEKMLCHEREFSIEDIHKYIHTYTGFTDYNLYGQRTFPKDKREYVIEEVRKEIKMHARASATDNLQNRIKRLPLLQPYYSTYLRLRKKLSPVSKGILDTLDCDIRPIAENGIAYTQIVTVFKPSVGE